MTGDTNDVLTRLQRALPRGWFPAVSPSRDVLLSAPAYLGSFVYGLIQFAHAQLRIQTASGGWLDLMSYDFFRGGLPRQPGQLDASFAAAIMRQLQAPGATRPALIANLETLTGNVPVVVEPWRPADVGSYSDGITDVVQLPAYYGYGSGAYGSLELPYQLFVTAYRPIGGGIANMQSYGTAGGTVGLGGYNVGYSLEWGSLSLVSGEVTDAQIYAEIAETIPAGTVAWVNLESSFGQGPPGAVSSVTITSTGVTDASVSWTAPTTGGAPLYYWVFLASTYPGTYTLVKTAAGTTSQVFGLTLDQEFGVGIMAVNADGPSPIVYATSPNTVPADLLRESGSPLLREDGTVFWRQ